MPQTNRTQWPGYTEETFPEIFNKVPPLPKEPKAGQLTKEQLTQLFEDGYVVLDSFFDIETEMNPVREGVSELVEELAQKLYDAGKVKSLYREYDLFERLIRLEKEWPCANILLLKLGRLPKGVRELWSNARMLNLVEQVLGTQEIVGHPVWNLRSKIPKNEATTVPWHQDSAYLDNDSYNVYQLTAWIPLLDATEENGCMQVMKRGHKSGRVAMHQCCHGGTWYVMLEEAEAQKTLGVDIDKDIITCPVPYGGMLLFSNILPHRSLSNFSRVTRWSLDLRWQDASRPISFYNIKPGVQLRSADPEFKVNWEAFDSTSRHEETEKKLAETAAEDTQAKDASLKTDEDEEFETTMAGPWMKKWELVHENRHTEAMEKGAV